MLKSHSVPSQGGVQYGSRKSTMPLVWVSAVWYRDINIMGASSSIISAHFRASDPMTVLHCAAKHLFFLSQLVSISAKGLRFNEKQCKNGSPLCTRYRHALVTCLSLWLHGGAFLFFFAPKSQFDVLLSSVPWTAVYIPALIDTGVNCRLSKTSRCPSCALSIGNSVHISW